MTRPTFAPSAPFAALTLTLAGQLADLECWHGGDEENSRLCDVWSATEKGIIQKPAEAVGDLLLKVEMLAKIAEDSVVSMDEWRALERDARQVGGHDTGLSFVPEAWLRRWTDKGGGYVRTDSGIAFVAPEPQTKQQGFLMDELRRANGSAAVAAYLDRTGTGEPIREAWDRLKDGYDTAHAAANAASIACDVGLPDQKQALVDASDAANHHEYVTWCAVMRAKAPDLAAVSWKMIDLFGPAKRWDDEKIDEWLRQFTDVIIDDLARLGGAA